MASSIHFKKISKSKIIYIVRDLFPEWLVSVGIIKKQLIYYFLKFLTFPQYTIPHLIGVESKNNLNLLKHTVSENIKLDVIYNWPSLSSRPRKNKLSNNNLLKQIKIKHNKIKTKFNLVYIYYNTGFAQNFENNINYLLKLNHKIFFL